MYKSKAMTQLARTGLLFALISAFFLSGCSKTDTSQTSTKSTPTTETHTATPLIQLPDFSSLVEKEGSAVVNISTTQTVHSRGVDIPGMSEDDPFYEFFKRFMPPDTAPRDYQTQSLGSGFIISSDGYILTNAHVVDDADEVVVKLTDKRQFKAKVIGADHRADVAIIKIDAKDLPTVAIGDPGKLKVGQWVVAIGSPFGFDNSVTAGIVSAKGRSLPDENYVPFIQTDVPINPGNSGGPLFNLSGEVVGINSQIFSRTGGYMGLSFAIPIDVAMNAADQLRSTGKVTRGRIGVQIQDMSPELAASFGLKDANGALVSSVEKDGPADKAGFQPGDVILKYDGRKVNSSTVLPPMVASSKPDSKVKIEIWRKGETKTLMVTVGELGPDKTAGKKEKRIEPTPNKLGLTLDDLSSDEKSEIGLNYGAIVDTAKGAAAKAGIREGDVILAVNNDKVESAVGFSKLLEKYSGRKTIALLIWRDGHTLYVPVTFGK